MSVEKLDESVQNTEIQEPSVEPAVGGPIVVNNNFSEAPPIDPPVTEEVVEPTAAEKEEEELNKLEPLDSPRRWVIGKTPEQGGNERTYSVYVQDKLGHMPRLRFFSLVSGTIVRAMKKSEALDIPGLDLGDGLSMRERADMISSGSFGSAGDFFKLALQLVEFSPDFLLKCYALWLNVPRKEVDWFMQVADQPWNPDNDQWGIRDEDGMEMVEVFIDQNYEDIRRFFSLEVPKIMQRAKQAENKYQAHESESAR